MTLPGYPALRSAARADATPLVPALLKSRYGYETHRLLTNAKSFEMLSALNDVRENLRKTTTLLATTRARKLDAGRQGYWVAGSIPNRTEDEKSWISNRAVSDSLRRDCKHVPGHAVRATPARMSARSLATFGGRNWRGNMGRLIQTMVAAVHGLALTSSACRPLPTLPRGEHSAFAGALMANLTDNNQLLTRHACCREIASKPAPQDRHCVACNRCRLRADQKKTGAVTRPAKYFIHAQVVSAAGAGATADDLSERSRLPAQTVSSFFRASRRRPDSCESWAAANRCACRRSSAKQRQRQTHRLRAGTHRRPDCA